MIDGIYSMNEKDPNVGDIVIVELMGETYKARVEAVSVSDKGLIRVSGFNRDFPIEDIQIMGDEE